MLQKIFLIFFLFSAKIDFLIIFPSMQTITNDTKCSFFFFWQNRDFFLKLFYNRVTSCGESRFQMSSAPGLMSAAAPSPPPTPGSRSFRNIEAGMIGGGGGVIGGDRGRGSVAVKEP